jgi:GNAT superfamily N-acetyltransferase
MDEINIADIELAFLADCSEFIPIIKEWYYSEWKDFLEEQSIEFVENLLKSRCNSDSLPLCIVAMHNDRPIGTASLKASDMHIRKELSPWLAGLYVEEKCRSLGIGSLLVQAIEKIASQHGFEKIFLYTPGASNFYQRLGWISHESVKYMDHDVTIMMKELPCSSSICASQTCEAGCE